MRAVRKEFGGLVAVNDVSFDVRAGEILGLIGPNGAGKSTTFNLITGLLPATRGEVSLLGRRIDGLSSREIARLGVSRTFQHVKTIAGIHPADEGRILFDGNEVRINGPTDAVHLGIATVYQDLALCDNLDVVENLFLGREEGGFALNETSMEKQTGELLGRLAVTIVNMRAEVGTLSGGQRQQVAIARSLLGDPKVVVLDEPTAALGVRQTAMVLDLIKRLREEGHAVVVVSHNLLDVFEVADRIFVLRLGRAAGDLDAYPA